MIRESFRFWRKKIVAFLLVCLERIERRLLYRPVQKPFYILTDFVTYATSQGPQQVYYNVKGTSPKSIWMCFGGNATDASIWYPALAKIRDVEDHVIVYVDYPGYHKCQGIPSPSNVQESSENALIAVCRKLNLSSTDFTINAFGWSLGAAAATQFALLHSKFRGTLILLAPFTSISDITRLRFGEFISYFVSHRWDVESMLKMLYTLKSLRKIKRIVIIHGKKDDHIPVWMSKRLLKANPNVALYIHHESDHWSIIEASVPIINVELACNRVNLR
jgi:pimeloyl-ACP methyl ester carboxylesterase